MAKTKESESKAATDAEQPVQKPKKTAAPKPKATTMAKASKGIARYIGIDVKLPQNTCADRSCPFHGTLPVRGQILEGEVVSDGMQSTVVVKREYMRKNQKYERLEKRASKYLVHSPPCLDISKGDHVKIMECRPLSKMVSFVVIEKMEQE
ncbi:MAG: 30S ribosomal protein S17 [Thermoplasmata archaeon]